MNRIIYENFKSYLIEVIRKKVPLFGKDIDDDAVNVGLYWLFYTLNKKQDKLDEVFIFYFDKVPSDIERDFKSSTYGKDVSVTNLMERYMKLSSMAYENRKLYFYLTKHTCYNDNDENVDCVKLIPVEKYKEIYDSVGMEHNAILDKLKLTDSEKYLFIDTLKLKSLFSLDFTTLPSIVRVNCNTEKYFKKLCDEDLLYRPSVKRFFTSYRCKCWPTKNISEYIKLHEMGQYGGSNTIEFIEKIFNLV